MAASELKQASRKWFQEARFGMFIHWGLFSIWGRDIWYYSREEVEKDHYEQVARRFNPVDYDPSEWARLARRAGMKYAVLTTKQHDGFTLWESEYTDYDMAITPYGKDLVKPWVEAFRAEGLKVGFYYSLLDWHHPHFTVDNLHPQRSRMAELNRTRDFSKYVEFLHGQVRELMTNYGKIDIFWPDFSYGPDRSPQNYKHAPQWQSERLKAMVEKLQPGILINNRLGIRGSGEIPCDFATPEQYIPKTGQDMLDATAPMWEACETIGASWGYYRNDHDVKSPSRLVSDLVTNVSNGGNLLLNVGPTARGRMQPIEVERLTQIGQWIDLHGDSIYGAGQAELIPPRVQTASSNTVRYTQRGRDLYVHFLGNYPSHDVILHDLGGKVDCAEFVSDRSIVTFSEAAVDGRPCIKLHLPPIQPDPYDTVIHVELKQ